MKLEGEIGEINVIERLVELGRDNFTGAVRFENDGIIKIIYFKNGDVLSASTNDRADSVDEILLRAGKVTREHVKQALAKRKETETLGDALLGLGFITRKELTWGRRVQVIGAIRSITTWTAGSYTIVADYLPKREEGTIFSLPQIIVELIVTDQDRTKFDRALDSGDAVLVPAPDFHESFSRLGLNQDAVDIVTHLDGVRSAAEIAVAAGKDAFNVYKLLAALETLGYVSKRSKAEVKPELSFDVPGPDLDFGAEGSSSGDQSWSFETPAATADASLGKSSLPDDLAADSVLPSAQAAPSPISMPLGTFAPAMEPSSELSSWEIHDPEPGAKASMGDLVAAGAEVGSKPLEDPEELNWGFDEAQIEAVRRADLPISSVGTDGSERSMAEEVAIASKPNRWVYLLIGAVVLIASTFAGFAGWQWWQGREAARNAPVATAPVVRHQFHNRGQGGGAGLPAIATTSTTGTDGQGVSPTPVAGLPITATAVKPSVTTPSGSMAGTPVSESPKAPIETAPARVAARPVPPARVRPGAMAATPSTTRIVRNAAGVATITNAGGHASGSPAVKSAPVVQPPATTARASDPAKAHYDEMAASFAANPSGSYTVQFELVCQASSLTRAIGEGASSVWFVPTSYRGQSCYRVFWGHYATRAEAQTALGELPAALKGSSPSVVSVPKK